MRLVSASFYFQNDKPDGLGLTFGPPGFSSSELTEMFAGEVARQYMRDSDAHLGTRLVETYLEQLHALAAEARQGPLPIQSAILAALNIMWLTERGFIPNDEFNGVMFVQID